MSLTVDSLLEEPLENVEGTEVINLPVMGGRTEMNCSGSCGHNAIAKQGVELLS